MQFDQSKVDKLTDTQKELICKLLAVSEDHGNSRLTVDTHNGQNYNIKGMGEGMQFGA